MSRKILITGTCQIIGIGAILKEIFPDDKLELTHPVSDDRLTELTKGCDYIIYDNFYKKKQLKKADSKTIVINFPNIYFPAFHPDIIYVRNSEKIPVEQSAIAIWCYTNSVSIDNAIKLYNKDTFFQLGYFNMWDKCITHLRNEFEQCGFDFNKFLLNVKREGVFMHTLNHPKINVLIQLGKQIAKKLGASDEMCNADYFIPDLLHGFTWAVYPEIGNALSVVSSYSWNLHNKHIYGLREFLENSYRTFEENKFDSSTEIHSSRVQHINKGMLNEVLSKELKKI